MATVYPRLACCFDSVAGAATDGADPPYPDFMRRLRRQADFGQEVDCRGPIVLAMSKLIFRARQMSLALLVVAVVDHGNFTIECSGSRPNSSGLVRLGRDLVRRSGSDQVARRASALANSP